MQQQIPTREFFYAMKNPWITELANVGGYLWWVKVSKTQLKRTQHNGQMNRDSKQRKLLSENLWQTPKEDNTNYRWTHPKHAGQMPLCHFQMNDGLPHVLSTWLLFWCYWWLKQRPYQATPPACLMPCSFSVRNRVEVCLLLLLLRVDSLIGRMHMFHQGVDLLGFSWWLTKQPS